MSYFGSFLNDIQLPLTVVGGVLFDEKDQAVFGADVVLEGAFARSGLRRNFGYCRAVNPFNTKSLIAVSTILIRRFSICFEFLTICCISGVDLMTELTRRKLS